MTDFMAEAPIHLMIRRLNGLYGAQYFYVVNHRTEKLSGGWATLERAVEDMKKMRRRMAR